MIYKFITKNREIIEIELESDQLHFSTLDQKNNKENYVYRYSDISKVHLGFNESIGYLCQIIFSDKNELKIRSGTLCLENSGSLVKYFNSQEVEYLQFAEELHKKLEKVDNKKLHLTAGDSLKSVFIVISSIFLVISTVFLIFIGQFVLFLLVLIVVPMLFTAFGKVQLKKTYLASAPPKDFLPKI